jgi:hypothetical protein
MGNSAFYLRIRKRAAQIIKKRGQLISIQPTDGGDYDPIEDTFDDPPDAFTAHGVAFEISNSEVDGTLIKRGDRMVILEVQKDNPVPKENWRIAINGATANIKAVKPLSPAGTTVLYELLIRG